MGGIGAPELIILLVVILLLFGSTKLPKLAKSLGEAQKEFKKGVADVENPPPARPENPDDTVTMSKAEYEALRAEREAHARKEAPPSA
jgi:sec-independent protein translocase protein TatA